MAQRLTVKKPEVGDRFGSWEVLELLLDTKRSYWRSFALCRCVCGTTKPVSVHNLAHGRSTQCLPCSSRRTFTKHGASDCGGKRSADRLYRIWKAMRWRCNPKNAHDKPAYFDRGIRVCATWDHDYSAFRDWATANGYAEDLTIDRIDNGRGYGPHNCRWVGYAEQAQNTRRNHPLTAFGETKLLAEWLKDPRCVVSYTTLRGRVSRGWPDEAAITLPIGSSRPRPAENGNDPRARHPRPEEGDCRPEASAQRNCGQDDD